MLIKSIAEDLPAFAAAVREGLPYKPLFVKLKLVWECNLRCQMCNHWRSKSSPLGMDFFMQAVDDLAELGCKRIHLTGGEPLLYPNLHRLVKHIKRRGIRPTLTTNGTLLSKSKALKLAKAGLRRVHISIDSPDSALHDELRGVRGSFRRTVKGFKALRAALPKAHMAINLVVSPQNYHTVAELPKLAHKLGANSIQLVPLDVHTEQMSLFSLAQLQHYNAEIAPRLWKKAQAYGLLSQEKSAYIFGQSEAQLLASSQGLYAADYYAKRPCYALWSHALIDHLGQVSLCCRLPNKPIMGSLQSQRFKEIWEGALYQELRQSPSLPVSKACLKCTMFRPKNRYIDGLLDGLD